MNRKQWKTVFSMCLLMLVVLSSALMGSKQILALGSGSGTTHDDRYRVDASADTVNPFPDKISDEELAAKQDSIFRMEFVLKDGTLVPWQEAMFEQTQQKYLKDIKQINWYRAIPESKLTYNLDIEGLSIAYAKDNVLPYSENPNFIYVENSDLQVDGKELDAKIKYFELNGPDHGHYFSGTFYLSDDIISKTIYRLDVGISPPYTGYSYTSIGFSTSIFWAHMHYVDELEYRKVQNLSVKDPVLQRSQGETWVATEPGRVLNLTDLKDPLVLSGTFPEYPEYEDIEWNIPYFRISGNRHYRTDSRRFNNERTEDGMKVIDTTERPTYNEAIHDVPLGYAYLTDDIDRPENPDDFDSVYPYNIFTVTDWSKIDWNQNHFYGNYFFSPVIFKDGTVSYDKHYYILERQMPSPVRVHKTDMQSNPMEDVTFSLYRVDQNNETLLAENLTTDANGDLYASKADTVPQDELTTLTTDESYNPETGYIVKEELAYLKPGTYRLKETSVPKGYKKNTFDFTVKAVQELVSDRETPVPVQDFTFKNEPDTTYSVNYSFVSKDAKQKLPQEVMDLLPVDENTYREEESVNAIRPKVTEVKTKEGIWKFDSYDTDRKIVRTENLKDGMIQFTGTWEFTPYTETIAIPKIKANDQTLKIGEAFDPLKGVTASDTEDGDLTDSVEVIENNVPVDKNGHVTVEGSYTVTYKVTNSKGASATKTVQITVKAKTEENDSKSEETKNKSSSRKNRGTKTSTGTYAIIYGLISAGALLGIIGMVLRYKKSR